MKKALIATLAVALITAVTAAGGSTRSAQQTMTYAGVKCFKYSTDMVCGLTSGTGYLASISENLVLVERFNSSKTSFYRAQPAGAGYGPQPSGYHVMSGSGAVCKVDESGPGIACVAASGSGYGWEITKSAIVVMNLDTSTNVFVRSPG